MRVIKEVWLRLTEPSPLIENDLDRFIARLLRAQLLLLFTSSTTVALIQTYRGINGVPLPIRLGLLSFVLVLYFGSRQMTLERIRSRTLIALGLIEVSILPTLFFRADDIYHLAPVLGIPVLFAATFLSARGFLLITSFNSIYLMMIGAFVSEEQGAIYVVSGFALIFLSILVHAMRVIQEMSADQQQTQLKLREQRYQSLLSLTFDANLVIENGQIRDVDEGFCDLFKTERIRVVQRPLRQFLDISDDILQQEIESSSLHEAIGTCADGSQLAIEYVRLETDSGGFPAEILAIRDISYRRKTEEALNQAQRLDSLGLMAGGIAHDFNNILMAIKAQASLAQRKIPAEAKAQKHLLRLLASTERASDLTRQLLAYAGKGRFETRTIDFTQFTFDLAKLLRSNLPTNVQFKLDLLDRELPITGDPGQLQQVLLNLVINATEAIGTTPGTISVSTRVHSYSGYDMVKQIMWDGSTPITGDYVQLTVEDSGCGMDEATLQRVFDPFFTTKETGTGLGLAATLGAIRAHHGNLQVFSEPNVGTRFVIWLPLTKGGSSMYREKRPIKPLPEPNGELILIIDDEMAVRESLGDVLTSSGYHVIYAENGKVGLDVYEQRQNEIKLVILDMQMPVMNGETTFYHLTAINPKIRILLSSGYSELSAVSKITRDRRVNFLAKPYAIDQLLVEVQKIIAVPVPG